jgi:hypothetical protein
VLFCASPRLLSASLCLSLGLVACGAATPVPTWWRDLDLHDLAQQPLPAPTRTLVVVFLDPECPVANGYVPVLNALAREFTSRGVAFIGAYSDPTMDVDRLRSHARDFAINFTTTDDRGQRLAHYANATYSSEAAVFDAKGKLLYRGRIDDRVDASGASRPAATRHDLRDVLLRILAGESGPFVSLPGYGCALATPLKSR